MINIRNFQITDLSEIAKIEILCFSQPWSYDALCDFTKYNHNHILVAEKDNKVAGYITYSAILDEVQIANVATHPDFRRQGIGKKLIEALISNSNGCSVITLEVRQSNQPAKNLYAKCGFEITATRKNFYSSPVEDAILMNYTF